MDNIDPLRFIAAFLFVIALIFLSAMALRRYGRGPAGQKLFGTMLSNASENERISLLEARYLDPRRRLVLVRRDRKEHLLLLADNREVVIESWDAKDDNTAHDPA